VVVRRLTIGGGELAELMDERGLTVPLVSFYALTLLSFNVQNYVPREIRPPVIERRFEKPQWVSTDGADDQRDCRGHGVGLFAV
jgi:hypothetical protein